MPHIKIEKLTREAIAKIPAQSPIVTFIADSRNRNEYLLGVEYKDEEFLLVLKEEPNTHMLKYDKVTRPLRVSLVKEAIDTVAKDCGFAVIHSNIHSNNAKMAPTSEYLRKIRDFEDITFDDFGFDRVSVEVGFGSGRHLLYQAKSNPDTLYIGIEIHTPSAQQVLGQIARQCLRNIWVVNYDARLLLEMMPSNSCTQIFVHFPVPWDKKPHRRVISPAFTEEALRALREGGNLELRTDSDKYFWYSMETFMGLPKASTTVEKNKDLEVVSKYEARWRKQEKDIYEVHLLSQENSDEKRLDIDFIFNNIGYNNDIGAKLPTETIISEDYFVHFERLYEIDKRAYLIKCAFGSFDRPEHKYILVEESSCRYLVSAPVKTRVNYQAHLKIMEYLNG